MSVTPTQGLTALLNAVKEVAGDDEDEAVLKEIAASIFVHLLNHGFGLARLSDEAIEQWSVMRLLAYGEPEDIPLDDEPEVPSGGPD